jgi:transposase-like protein
LEIAMLATPKRIAALLPKGWPTRVRSAVVHAISMSNVVFAVTRSHAENHFNARVRVQAENDRLRREVSLLTEELRIKDSRMERIPPQRRPHYPPVERLAILELRAARGWSLAQTARRLLVTPLTVTSWNKRLDDEGPASLVQLREPVNRFPEFVQYIVRRLKVHCPSIGSRRLARVLARAGLHIGATTMRRMLRRPVVLERARAAAHTETDVASWFVARSVVSGRQASWVSCASNRAFPVMTIGRGATGSPGRTRTPRPGG